MNTLTRYSLIISATSFVLIFLIGFPIQLAITRGYLRATPALDAARKSLILLLFFLFAMGIFPGFLSLFVRLQGDIGNQTFPLVRLLRDHHTAATLTLWSFMSLGLLLALPSIAKDLLGLDLLHARLLSQPAAPQTPADAPIALPANPSLDQDLLRPTDQSASESGIHLADPTRIRNLLNAGANPNARDPAGRTPLHKLLEHPIPGADPHLPNLLLQLGADVTLPDSQGRTPLMLACRSSPDTLIRQMLLLKPNLNTPDHDGATPLTYAIESARPDIVNLLRSSGALSNPSGYPDPTTAVRNAKLLRTADRSDPDALQSALTTDHADPNARDRKRQTPLIRLAASMHASPEAAQLLLDAHADLTLSDSQGRTPLAVAAAHNQQDLLSLLLSKGSSLTTRDHDGLTPLMHAARAGSFRCTPLLLTAGADPAATDPHHRTPLLLAASSQSIGSADVVNQLLAAGFPPDTPDDTGQTPLIAAAQSPNPDAVNSLLTHHARVTPETLRAAESAAARPNLSPADQDACKQILATLRAHPARN